MARQSCWRWLLLAVLGLCLLPGASPARQGDSAPLPTPYLGGTYRALVIGNNAYRDPEGVWPPLKTAVNDAEAVARALREDHGFGAVTLLRDATLRQTIGALNDLAAQVQPDDSVLIFYAGHGYLRESTREGFWIPVDAEGRDDATFVPNAIVRTKVAIIAERAKHVLLVSDSCFSGALLREGARGIRLEEKTPGYLQSVARKKSVQVLAAGGLEFVDDNYRGSGHSPFTYFLLNELRYHPGAILEATDLSTAVARNVANNVAQTPERGILYGAGHEGGEFLLAKRVPPGPAPVSVAASAVTPPPTAVSSTPEPQAALPLPAALPSVVSATAAGGVSAVAVMGGLGGVGLLAYSVSEYQAAMQLHSQALDEAKTDPEKSAKLQDERNTAATRAAVGAVLGVVLTVVVIASASGDSVAAAPVWGWAPTVSLDAGRTGGGVLVRYRW